MKIKHTLLLPFIAFTLALTVLADTGAVNLFTNGTVANNTTRTTGFTDVKVNDNEIVSLQVEAACVQVGTGDLRLTLARSKDGLTFETAPRQVIGFALNGTTAIVGFTNLTQLGGTHTLRLISVQNADASAIATNVTISVVKKTVRTR